MKTRREVLKAVALAPLAVPAAISAVSDLADPHEQELRLVHTPVFRDGQAHVRYELVSDMAFGHRSVRGEDGKWREFLGLVPVLPGGRVGL